MRMLRRQASLRQYRPAEWTRHWNQRGFILVGVLSLIPLFFMISLTGSYTAQMELQLATNTLFSVQALAAAEAGIEHAADLLQSGAEDGFDNELSSGGTGGSLTSIGSTATLNGTTYRFNNFGSGANDGYYVRVIDNYDETSGANDASTDTDNYITIVAVGRVNSAERMIEAGYQAGTSFYDMAIFGDDEIYMDSNACTDSYSSSQGAYGGSNIGTNGDAGTNSTGSDDLELKSNTCVQGDAIVGPGGNPSNVIHLDGGASISGSQSAAGSAKDLPQVSAPSGLPDQGSIDISGNCPHGVNDSHPHAATATQTISSDGKYSEIKIDSNDCLRIDTSGGDITLEVGKLEIKSNGHIDITGGGKVTMYVTDDVFYVDGSAKIHHNSLDPSKLEIFGTDGCNGDIDFKSDNNFYGTIYARKAHFKMDSSGNFYGAVIAEKIDLKSNAQVHYDSDLGVGEGMGMLSWHEMR